MRLRVAEPDRLQRLAGTTMGTHWRVALDNPDYQPLPAIRQTIEAVLAQVIADMSHWEPDSALSRFNRAPAGSWHHLPADMETVLRAGIAWAECSAGAFDPSLGALVAAWGFGPTAPAPQDWRPASAAAIAQALACSGWQRLEHSPDGQWRQPGGLHLDFSGIAKGFAVDAVWQRLQALGFAHCLVEMGGEIRASGQRPDGQPWRVALAPTEGQTAGSSVVLQLQDHAVATSGSLYHQHQWQGRSYSHTLDGRSGQPIAHALQSVTVLHRSCMHADALATVLTVLGPEAGRDFAHTHAIAALLISPEGPWASSAWQQHPCVSGASSP